ncbi:MAG: hypothetical protein NTX26_01475 [Candidatus Parcubacteria bacterium]|nr:hypothetical protein [Candidatus Parcubacteria bacterium]
MAKKELIKSKKIRKIPNSVTTTPVPVPTSVSWQGNQPGYYKRNGLWYFALTIVTLLFMLYAYKTKSNSFLVLVVALYFLLLAKGAQSPQTINFSVDQNEILIDSERHYPTIDFDKYYSIDSPEIKYIVFRYKETAHEDLILPVAPEKMNALITLLEKIGLEEDLSAREPMVHYLSRVLKI